MSGPFATPKTKLEWALWHAHRGCFVFQLVENEKIPIEKGFPEKATRDEGSIRRWWTDRPNANIAIYTGRFGNGDESLLVVDIDVKDGKDGFHTLEELACFDYILSPTWRIRTTTGESTRSISRRSATREKSACTERTQGWIPAATEITS